MSRRIDSEKRPFNIHEVMEKVGAAVQSVPKAALFELADDGYSSPFEILIACIISIRTFDEVTIPTAKNLFQHARTPIDISKLTVEKIDELIRACTFHLPKAKQIHAIAKRVVDEFNGDLPCDLDVLLSLRGVGPKCANLTLGIAYGKPASIPVDIHVHRVTNRWGYIQASTPEKTMFALEQVLPKKYWLEINKLLVPFGKHVCTGVRPKCSTCPVLDMCKQVGVTEHR